LSCVGSVFFSNLFGGFTPPLLVVDLNMGKNNNSNNEFFLVSLQLLVVASIIVFTQIWFPLWILPHKTLITTFNGIQALFSKHNSKLGLQIMFLGNVAASVFQYLVFAGYIAPYGLDATLQNEPTKEYLKIAFLAALALLTLYRLVNLEDFEDDQMQTRMHQSTSMQPVFQRQQTRAPIYRKPQYTLVQQPQIQMPQQTYVLTPGETSY